MKDKGKGYRIGQREPSDHDADLTLVKGNGGGSRMGQREPQADTDLIKCQPTIQSRLPVRGAQLWAEMIRLGCPAVHSHWMGLPRRTVA